MSSGVLTPEQQRQVMDSALQLMSAHDLAEITLEQLTHASGVSAFDIIRLARAPLDRSTQRQADGAGGLRIPPRSPGNRGVRE